MTFILETPFNGIESDVNKMNITLPGNKDLNISELTCDLEVTI